ncbi:MAG TPA: biotin--[acetyl-CoA-carboxylase] ligase, partial [Solirubrobacterales bacterium]|nr:biotin--[acetyl-CoA-carboxylase] ligase [Solirubrobacterales bacterium]
MRNKGRTPKVMSFGAPHRHYARTDSTNTRVRELAAAGAPHGTVVTAAEQTAGRGRQGRTWTAPAGKALLYSALLRPLEERHLTLPLAVPLAVCAAAEELRPGIECAVKWPNDIWLDGRKLAGVLIEARPQDGWAVIGTGLNLYISTGEFPPDLRDTAVSLFDPSASPFDPSKG